MATSSIAAGDLRSLRVGDIIATETDAASAAIVSIDGKPKFRAKPGAATAARLSFFPKGLATLLRSGGTAGRSVEFRYTGWLTPFVTPIWGGPHPHFLERIATRHRLRPRMGGAAIRGRKQTFWNEFFAVFGVDPWQRSGRA